MGYFKDLAKLRTGEVLTTALMQSKLTDADRIFAESIQVRKDIMAIITRLNLLKAKVRSKKLTSKGAESIQKGILAPMRDELSKLFSIVEDDTLLMHDLIGYMHELLKIDYELAKEKVAQVHAKVPKISSQEDAEKAQKQIDAAKKKIEEETRKGQEMFRIKTTAANSAQEIKRLAAQLKKQLKIFRNQFDAMRRTEVRRVMKSKAA